MKAEIFHPQNLTENDIKLLVKACQRMYDLTQPVDLVRKCLEGQMTFWRTEHGLFGTSCFVRNGKLVLWVEFVAIPGVGTYLKEFFECLKFIAQDLDCDVVSTAVVPGPLQKFYEQILGFVPRAILYEEPVK